MSIPALSRSIRGSLESCLRTSRAPPLRSSPHLHQYPRFASTGPNATIQQPLHTRKYQEAYKARNKALLYYTTAVIFFVGGASYAAVPMYRAFCSATGYNGTPMTSGRFDADRLVPLTEAKSIKVHFNADKSSSLPWSFTPQQKFVIVKPGETSLAFYKARNDSKDDIIGIATYNVTPAKVAPYFSKVECFCFEEQKLRAGEEVDMPLLFFIDKDCLEDDGMKDVDDIVLSYTFFKARRNARGHLEPDASHDEVQASQGFQDFPSIDPNATKPSQ